MPLSLARRFGRKNRTALIPAPLLLFLGGNFTCRSSVRLATKRWVNLWPPQSFAESFTPTGASGEESSAGGDQQEDGTERDASAGLSSDISSAVFMGNLVLFAAILTGIYVVHIALASGVEAYWIAKVRLVSNGVSARETLGFLGSCGADQVENLTRTAANEWFLLLWPSW